MGTVRETLAESTEGTPQYGPERARAYSDRTSEEKDRYNADIRTTNILLQGLPKDIYTLINHYTDAKDIWDNVKMLLEGSELTKPALYNGHEIIKDNHALAIVHNIEDTLEMTEITKKKINDKMNDPESTFTPQKQLTPEQIFWSNDLMKLKSEALKERTKVSRPIKALTVVKEFQINRMNPGLNMRFWTWKDVDRSGSSATWRALLVDASERETTDF
nr:hypothetical protein [Tanacetum cinerariifolium]